MLYKMFGVQDVPAVEAIDMNAGRRCKGWCGRTCIIIAVGVVLFLITAAVAGIIAAAVDNGMCHVVYHVILFYRIPICTIDTLAYSSMARPWCLTQQSGLLHTQYLCV